MSSALLRSRSGSATARLAWTHFGSIRFSHGLLTGNWQIRIRTPPSRLARRLWARTHERTSLLTCQLALSHTNSNAFLPSAFSNSPTQVRKAVVTGLTGRPSTISSKDPVTGDGLRVCVLFREGHLSQSNRLVIGPRLQIGLRQTRPPNFIGEAQYPFRMGRCQVDQPVTLLFLTRTAGPGS